MFPQHHEHSIRVYDSAEGAHHALPDARHVAQVEHVVELGWRGQQLCLTIEYISGFHKEEVFFIGNMTIWIFIS